jgi:hypothetical protein
MAWGILFLSSFLDDYNSVAVNTVWYKESRDTWARGKWQNKNKLVLVTLFPTGHLNNASYFYAILIYFQ